jgi:hypothetical protein
MTRRMLFMTLCLLVSKVVVPGVSAEVLFGETFVKGSGQVQTERTFDAVGGAAVMSFTNGGGVAFDGVKQGTITLNGNVVIGSQDFKIDGTIARTIALENGTNRLSIRLVGAASGQLAIEISRGEAALEFAPGTIFVSTVGTDSSTCGTARNASCHTIQRGLERAAATGGPQVAVAAGIYLEGVSLVSGIHVLGGFDNEFSRRDIASMRPIVRSMGASSSTVSAVGIVSPTLFEGFVVLGPVPTTPGGNSIGIDIRNSSNALVVVNNIVFAGVGAGGSVGTHGGNGGGGQAGSPGINADGTIAFGGPGGFGSVFGGVDPHGGNGGTSTNPVFDQPNGSGQDGGSVLGGAGGAGGLNGKWSTQPTGLCVLLLPSSNPLNIDARDGAPGGLGSPGFGGIGANDGRISSSGDWVTNVGGAGGSGGSGGGGGGGGAGGGAEAGCNPAVFGPSGGGGGGGGAGGMGGGGGQGGGAAFGILVFLTDTATRPVIGANQIYLGIGGPGGNGGNGGVGGLGGEGAPGGAAIIAKSGHAGAGGNGGDGGPGGPGGGGAGGSSIGVGINFEHLPYQTDNEIITSSGVAGSGGSGGLTRGNAASAGQSGQVYAVRVLVP